MSTSDAKVWEHVANTLAMTRPHPSLPDFAIRNQQWESDVNLLSVLFSGLQVKHHKAANGYSRDKFKTKAGFGYPRQHLSGEAVTEADLT
jgi:hypothetical protein